MKKIFYLPLFWLLITALAVAQGPCTGGATTNCTDYFGAANYANSPLPAGSIAGFTIVAGGSGYSGPTVVITDPTGTGASANATVDASGAINGVSVLNGGSGYIAPVITIVDGGTTGSGAMVTASLGGPFTGGMRKFVDGLGAPPFAVPNTVTFPGSDYYVIGLVEYTQKMHTDLPSTKVRGYVQLNGGSGTPSYLGPIILAQKNRPVRVLFKNMLPTGAGGNLFIPVDATYMGAGAPYAQNRATLHLHGGNTPWISDGTPHQWTTPPGESVPQRGVSTQFVPDMWFDGSGNLIASCAGQPTCPTTGATNDPGAGNMTFFWTNQQGGRLMFYHDHAYGITRLNVYAGEAAGYLLYDPVEEAALANATAPGTLAATPDGTHLYPLVIQDKTFVPSAAQLKAEDPTWTSGGYGTTPGAANPGDLWFPHVYVPNQNPADPDGVNAFGRWDYGPWFFPPQTNLTAGPLTVPCTSSAFPGATLLDCPITPNPSGTPEGFMDTPVVNGVAYPVLKVAPAAYRFQILSAGNDRSWNLQLYVADSTGKEVAMLPAVPPASGTALPLCSTPTTITSPNLGVGLATATLDATGNPLNGTGLPANCWPTSWPTDGRDGGVPDPRSAGPPIIEIGSEGGLLPTPVIIPSTPTGYEYNRRSVTVLNVSTHGLWLGPAERADVIVDFSAFAGKTLIMYNDAPAPAPAFDTRNDYYTGDADQTAQGGAPSTQPGYGPNTRTIMQIVVDPNIQAPNAQTFSLPALKAAFTPGAGGTGLFVATQPTVIVPESTYGSAYNTSFSSTYSSIQATSLSFQPIAPLKIVQPGLGVQPCSASSPKICVTMEQKAIQELFTADYGRMNATLGTEMPLTNFLTQTTIPLAYIDPPTEIIQDGETQLWKITHNGVDTHFIHFHLFNVQVVNRIGWDGTIRPPDGNELGWKDTVRMNPLEDIVVALQPIKPILPWPIPDSIRPMDVTAPASPTAQFTGVDPYTNTPAAVPNNGPTNFGWEYVWHCHILGHEENDMMRPIVFQVSPPAPSNLAASGPDGNGVVTLSWTDNSANETGFTLQRDIDPGFPSPTAIAFGPSSKSTNAAGQGTDFGGAITAFDNPGSGGPFFYRVQAVDDGFKGALTQSWNSTPALVSAWSNTAQVGASPSASVAPLSLTFASQLVNTLSAEQQVILSNGTGAGTLAISSITVTGTNAGDFVISTNTCTASLAGGANCTIGVIFKPVAVGARSATVAITSTNNPPVSVPLSGTGIAPVASVSPAALVFSNTTVGVLSTAQTVNLSNTGTAPLTINSIALSGGNSGDFAQSSNCGLFPATLQPNAGCVITVTFKPTAMGTRSTVLVINNSDPVNPKLNVSLTGTGVQAIATLSAQNLTFPLQLVNTTSATQTVTLSNTGNVSFTINSIGLAASGNPSDFLLSYTCSIGGVLAAAPGPGSSCTINVSFRPTASGNRSATINISTSADVNPSPSIGLAGSGTSVSLSTGTLTFAPQVVNTSSSNLTVTLTNVGPTALVINSLAIAGLNATDFSFGTNCPIGGTGLGVGARCNAAVKFKPSGTGVRNATLNFNTKDLGLPTAPVALVGTGILAPVNLTPLSWNFGGVTVNQTSTPQVFVLANGSTTVLSISSIRLNGNNPSQFAITGNTCGTSLAMNATCTITVVFKPTATGSFSASLRVSDSAPNSPQTAALSGTGR
ncbi:MAG TPA: choice-of-anchor D domain-containing protein [Terriglobales bacterium]